MGMKIAELAAGSCLKLREHSEAVCRIVGSHSLSCKQLKSDLDARCSKALPKENEPKAARVVSHQPHNRVQMLDVNTH